MRAAPRPLLLALLALTAGGCATVKMHRVRPDWEQVDRQRVKRLVIVTQPLPAGDQQVGEMWSKLAAKRVDLKRNFIILEKAASQGAALDPKTRCADGVDGVLWLRPEVKRQGDGVEAAVQGRLFRCTDGAEVWAADAAGSWASEDAGLKETVTEYVDEFGPGVRPYVVASYRLLNATLDTLPDPVLTSEEQDEKIENAQ